MRERPRGAHDSASPGWARPAGRALCWGVAYYLAGQLGVATTLPGKPLALVAPTAGLLVIWFSLSTRRTLPWDAAALVLAGMLLSTQLGLPPALVAFGAVISLSQAAVFVGIMRRYAGGLAPFGGSREDWRIGDLGVFLAAALATATTVAVLSTASQGLAGLPTGDLETFLVRWGRSAATIVAMAPVGLLLAPGFRRARTDGRVLPWARELLPAGSGRWAEAVALVSTTAALYVAVFYIFEDFPISFVLVVVTAWVGIRFSVLGAATHSLLGGAAGVTFTLLGYGRFADSIADPAQQAAVAQLFVLVVSMTGLTLAITRSQLAASEHLAENRLQMLNQVLDEVHDGIALIEEDGTIVMLNPAGYGLFDVAGDRLDRVRPAESFDLYDAEGERVSNLDAPYLRALRGDEVDGDVLELRNPDGSPHRFLKMNAHVLKAAVPGAKPRVLVSYHDITGERMRQDALATFAGHVAHDLRNPLTVVEAWNEVLNDAFEEGRVVTPAEGLPLTGKIAAASIRMRLFIHALLDYTLARDRALTLDWVDLVAVAEDVAAERGDVHDELAPVVTVSGRGRAWADPVLVRIVVDNLVANACKYVAEGVRPVVRVQVEPGMDGHVHLCVTDNGIGIPVDQRQQVFESFHRVERNGRFDGIGLGLGICQRIVQRHRGTIEVEDAPGGGTRMRVRLPAHAVSTEETSPLEDVPAVAVG